MSKNRKKISDGQKLIIGFVICVVIIIIASILWLSGIVYTPVVQNSLFLIMTVFLFSIVAFFCACYLIGCIIDFLIYLYTNYKYKKNKEKIDKENAVKIKKLPNEFTEVGLKDISTLLTYISGEDIHCKAMLDENGKVILQIRSSIEVNIGTTDYTWILNHFNIE